MRCPKCELNNPLGTEFCTNCGTEVEAATAPTASAAFCTQCGSQVSSEARFCSHCGTKLVDVCPQCGSEAIPGAQFCSQCGQDLTKGAIRQGVSRIRAFPLPNTIAAGVGAIMMLISLAAPWYAMRLYGSSTDISARVLISETGNGGLTWAGSALPLILMIVFASIVLFSVIYSLFTKVATSELWAWLGALSALCVISNAVYILWWMHDNFHQWVNIVHSGSILAFVGAFVVMFSASSDKRTT